LSVGLEVPTTHYLLIDSLKPFFSHAIILIFDRISNALLRDVRVKRAG
jgi:hypothetical protein